MMHHLQPSSLLSIMLLILFSKHESCCGQYIGDDREQTLEERTLDNSANMNGTGKNDTGEDLRKTIYPPPTTLRPVQGFTAEAGSSGKPFYPVAATAPPGGAAMTSAAGAKPMIVVGAIMLVGCIGGGIYLYHLHKVKMGALPSDDSGEPPQPGEGEIGEEPEGTTGETGQVDEEVEPVP